jgi:1D-myo-inositol 3-kinase
MNGASFTLEKSNMHNELHAALQEAAVLMSEQQQADPANGSGGDICSA